jgi:cold shock CspA family protein
MSQEIETNVAVVPATATVPVLDEIRENNENTEKYIGQCKWFSDKLGYGFLTICDGDKKGTDIFSHHSGIKPLNSNYKTLKKGEYVEFGIVNGLNGLQAVNVTGINGGALMCDFVTSRKGAGDEGVPYPPPPPPPPRAGNPEGWQEVGGRKFTSSNAPRVGAAPHPKKKQAVSKYNKKAVGGSA